MAHLAQRLRRPRVLAGGALAVLLLLLVVVALASRSSVASPTSPDTSAPAAPASAVKVLVDRAGMVQLTGADLDAARLGWNKIDPSRIQLSYRGQEQPLWVQGQGSSLTFRFYAQASHSRYSRQNVYWLEIGDKSAQPMEVISTTGSTPWNDRALLKNAIMLLGR